MKRWKKISIWASAATAVCSLGLGGVAYSLNFVPVTANSLWITSTVDQKHMIATNKIAGAFGGYFTWHYQGIDEMPNDIEWSILSTFGDKPDWLVINYPNEKDHSTMYLSWTEDISTGYSRFKVQAKSESLGLIANTDEYSMDILGEYEVKSEMNSSLEGYTGKDVILSNPIIARPADSSGKMPADLFDWEIFMCDEDGGSLSENVPEWLTLDKNYLEGQNSQVVRVRVSGASAEEAGTYYFVVKITCKDPKIQFDPYVTSPCELRLTAEIDIPQDKIDDILNITHEEIEGKDEVVLNGFKSGIDWSSSELENVNTLTVPNEVTYVANYAFAASKSSWQQKITNVIFNREDSQCWHIGNYSFGKLGLGLPIENFDLPNKLQSIGDMSFRQMRNITSLEFGTEFETCGDTCFCGDVSLSTITFDGDGSKLKMGGFCFSECSRISTLIFKKLDKIPEQLALGCFASLAPNGLIIVEDGAISKSSKAKTELLNFIYQSGTRLPAGWTVL